MAAYASLISLMNLVHDLQHHHSSPISLDRQLLDSITQSLAYFQEFLHSYNSSSVAEDDDEEEVADPLEMRIAAAAYAAEDAIEFHIVDCINHKRNNMTNDDEKIKSFNICCGILRNVIEEMDLIKKVVVDAHKKPKALVVVHDQVAMANFPASIVAPPNEALVGSDGVVLELMEKLAGGQLDCQIFPIVGMGGIGKTYLAKTIYAKRFIKDRFDICAWATISQQYNTREILCELLSQATNTEKEELSGKSEDVLGLELHKYLFSRRFLVVMDDIWSIDAWDKIQCYFPNNCNGSRVLVTTRLSQLSSQLNSNDYSLHMDFLDKAKSWDLFSKTVFGEKCFPPELEEVGEKIVDNCRGLPLSIAVVGGLLKKMDSTRASWESIGDNFTSVVNMENDKHCLRLLKLSYNHLHVYLKPCFLYMGVFEEDEEIRVASLVQLWVSEGFLKPTDGEALETTARGFLQDLVDRNLILIGELGTTGRLRFCKLHDLVRDMCLKEGQKEGFYHIIGKCNPPRQGMNAQRRIVIPKCTSEENVCNDLRSMSHTRSINCGHRKVALSGNLVLLRTLQGRLKDALFSTYDDNYRNSLVFRHVNLRHVAVKVPNKWSFNPSVSCLWNLQTLIISYSFMYEATLFADFWKMPQFRHMQFVHGYASLPDPPNGDAVVIMENIHTLKGIRNFKLSEGVVKRILNIKRLKLKYDDDCDVYFVGNMEYLCGLEFLSVTFCPRRPITPMRKITFPHSLKKLSLRMEFNIIWDDMLEKIGSLPLLEKLKIYRGYFGKGRWEIAQGQFPCLKYLQLDSCNGLVTWTASEEDSSILPRLEHLRIGWLVNLKDIPCELGNIDTLKSIKLTYCGDGLVRSVKEMFDEQVELQGGEEQLSFHVDVIARKNQQHLLSLASPKFCTFPNFHN